MLRNYEPWTLGEPKLSSRGEPIIHDIAFKLGCIRNSGEDLPAESLLPENETELVQLAKQREGQEQQEEESGAVPMQGHNTKSKYDSTPFSLDGLTYAGSVLPSTTTLLDQFSWIGLLPSVTDSSAASFIPSAPKPVTMGADLLEMADDNVATESNFGAWLSHDF